MTEANTLYAVVDLDNNEEMLCVGNIHEISEYAGVKEPWILTQISRAKKRGYRCKYVRIGREDEDL